MDLDIFQNTYCLYCGTQQCDPTDPEWLAGCRRMKEILEMKKESTQMDENLKLSPPWDIFEHEIEALFGQDPDITIKYDRANFTIKLFVDNVMKATALIQILPTEKKMGSITIKLEVVPVNDAPSTVDLYKSAFQDNPVFHFADSIIDEAGFKRDYVIFNKEVVQFFCDDISDYFGACSTLYEDIARDVFDTNEVCFCTDIEEKDF